MAIEVQVWRRRDLTLFGTHFGGLFLREMAEIAYLTNQWVFHFILFAMIFYKRTPLHQKSPHLVQWVTWCEQLHAKSRVHAAANCAWAPRRGCFKLKCVGKPWSRATFGCWAWNSPVTLPWEPFKRIPWEPFKSIPILGLRQPPLGNYQIYDHRACASTPY